MNCIEDNILGENSVLKRPISAEWLVCQSATAGADVMKINNRVSTQNSSSGNVTFSNNGRSARHVRESVHFPARVARFPLLPLPSVSGSGSISLPGERRRKSERRSAPRNAVHLRRHGGQAGGGGERDGGSGADAGAVDQSHR